MSHSPGRDGSNSGTPPGFVPFSGTGHRLGAVIGPNEETATPHDGVLSPQNVDFLRHRVAHGNRSHLGLRHTHNPQTRVAAAQRAGLPQPGFRGDAFELSPPEMPRALLAQLSPVLAQGVPSDAEHNQEMRASIRNAVTYADGKLSAPDASDPQRQQAIAQNSQFAVADFGGSAGRYDGYTDDQGNKAGKKFGVHTIPPEQVLATASAPANLPAIDPLEARFARLQGNDPVIDQMTDVFAHQVNRNVDHLRVTTDHQHHTPAQRRALMLAAAEDRAAPRQGGPSRVQQQRAAISQSLDGHRPGS